MRYKGVPPKPPEVRKLGAAAERRILSGEPWLRVWSQELTIPLVTIAKKSKLSMERLFEIEREEITPSEEELELIAAALGTTVYEIERVQD